MTVVVVLLVVAAVLLRPPQHDPGALSAPRAPAQDGPSPARSGATALPAPTTGDVGEAARLLSSALRSGIGVVDALDVVAELGPARARGDLRVVVAAARWGLPPDRCWEQVGARWESVATALVAADEAGLSPVRALEAAAARLDRERGARVVTAVRRVEVLVVLPLGLAFLPGFVLAAVVPLVLGLASGLAGH